MYFSALFTLNESVPGEPPILSVVEDLADSAQEVEDGQGNSKYWWVTYPE